MSESPGDRFRRIIGVWREQKKHKQSPAVPPAPTARNHATPPPQAAPALPDLPTPKPQPREVSSPPGQTETAIERGLRTQPFVPAAHEPAEKQSIASGPSLPEIPSSAPRLSLDDFKTPADARRFLERLRNKTSQTVQDFSDGLINQHQFQAVYSHYQRQRVAVENALIEMPGSGAWRAAAVEGHTSFLRQQHAAQVLSYAIYETASGLPLSHVGDFSVDDALLVPMLSTFRSSTQELFGAGMKRVELEGGRSLCYVPGRYTTLIVIFSAEPAAIQLRTIEDLHRDFEMVNQYTLSSGKISKLALTFTHLWAFDEDLSGP
jgi:hypothetical protein